MVGTAAARGPDPAFDAALWAFIADARAGRAHPGPQMFEIADCLAAMCWELICQVQVRTNGGDRAAAEAYADELVATQRALYGSLAADASS